MFTNLQDEHLINHFVKNDLLKPIVDAFVGNGNRYNLLNSAVLELFEYIQKVHSLFTFVFWSGICMELVNYLWAYLFHAGKSEIIA